MFYRNYQYPPISYSNLTGAHLCHWVNSVPDTMRHLPYIIEPNDNPLAPTGKSEPHQVLKNIDLAMNTYLNVNCKKILVESEGQLNLFKRYFHDSFDKKLQIIRMGAIAQPVCFETKIARLENPVFLCFASDYKRKAVDLLIRAWLQSSAKATSKLILACPNVPFDLINLLEKNNVEVITKAPLTYKEKYKLLNSSHVVIAPLHVDGGANIIEAFEMGLPIITMRSQRSFIRDDNGWEVDVPFYFYDEGYGTEWPTWNRFWELIDEAKQNQSFDMTINGFVDIFDDIVRYPEKLITMGKASHDLAKGEFSLENRNNALRAIYKDAMNS